MAAAVSATDALSTIQRHLMASASTSGSPTIEAASAVPGVAPTPPAVPGTAAQAARDDDILILSAARTPIGKAKRGSFRDLTPDLLLRPVLQAVMERCPGLPREEIADVVIGNVRAPGSGAEIVRMSALLAGVPVTAGATACNRQCSSGLQAIAAAAGMIRLGTYDTAIAGGFESMSQLQQQPPTMDYSSLEASKQAADCAIPMGDTSEVVARRYGVSREDQDRVAALSQQRAEAAQKGGLFDEEIVPVRVAEEGSADGGAAVVSKDDGVRAGTTAAKLARLRPAFDADGSSTAGNSSQVSDGAAAVLLMRRGRFDALGLAGTVKPMGVLRSFVVVGVEPDEMGVGPAYAIPPALRRAGVLASEIDAFEINEAFASQYLHCLRVLGLDEAKVNPLGGAIALGHPLGCTGARQVVTLLHHLRRTGGRYGVVSMCIGTGMGAAAVLEREE